VPRRKIFSGQQAGLEWAGCLQLQPRDLAHPAHRHRRKTCAPNPWEVEGRSKTAATPQHNIFSGQQAGLEWAGYLQLQPRDLAHPVHRHRRKTCAPNP
jgi:hypothetical protein